MGRAEHINYSWLVYSIHTGVTNYHPTKVNLSSIGGIMTAIGFVCQLLDLENVMS